MSRRTVLAVSASNPPNWPRRYGEPRATWSMVSIRTATPADLQEVIALWQQFAGPTRHAGGIDEVTRLSARDPEALLVAVDDDAIVGAVIVGWDGWRAHLYRLAVDSAVRRSGTARALVEEAGRRARARGAVRVDAMVNLENVAAVGFWQALGFDLEQHDGRFSFLL